MGSIGIGGLTLPQLLCLQQQARAGAKTRKRHARSVIVLYLNGGPSQLDMFDLKPHGPVEIRGTFQPVDTNVPGIQLSEHMPRMTQVADKYTIIRSMTHKVRGHPSANYFVLTGTKIPPNRGAVLRSLSREDQPHFGSVISKLQGSRSGMPPFVLLPEQIHPTGVNEPHPVQFAGYLGAGYDPYLIDSDPNLPEYSPGALKPNSELNSRRLESRLSLLKRIDQQSQHLSRTAAATDIDLYYEKAFDLLSSKAAQSAFNVDSEPDNIRDRYGRHAFGQSTLLARRLIEAGVRLVHVNWFRNDNGKGGQGFDSHSNHLDWAQKELLPPTDAAFTALVEDLDQRGMLDETLVLMMGEFGRTPKINENAGRDHWPDCFSIVMAGGGIQGGRVYGSSDEMAAYPKTNPVSPPDLLATLYSALGIDQHTKIYDQLGRAFPLTEGRPVDALF